MALYQRQSILRALNNNNYYHGLYTLCQSISNTYSLGAFNLDF